MEEKPNKEKILVVEDEEDIAQLIRVTLADAGMDVRCAGDGMQALKEIRYYQPDLVIMDINMPRMDGYELCQKIRSNIILQYLPVIMLTVRGDVKDRIRGLQLGTDDYLIKPFDPGELLARVKSILRRTASELAANPLTQLPGNVSINRELEERIRRRQPFCVLFADLNNFKAYNDKYSYIKGDLILKTTAQIVIQAVKKAGNESDFVGHLGGDDFIVISTPDKAEALCRYIIGEFDRLAPGFYNKRDREKGFIMSRDRKNHITRFPLMGIAIGVVTNLYREFEHSGEVSGLGAELKAFAKKKQTSHYVIDKRRE